MSNFDDLFTKLGGIRSDFPRLKSAIRYTNEGTPVFQAPSIALVCRPQTDLSALRPYLDEFPASLGFRNYLDDPTRLDGGSQICKAAGQGCYLSYGKGHTPNEQAQKYVDNIVHQGHFSVLEHANYTFHIHGVSRSLLAELTRHRHFSLSVESQRYCGDPTLRWVKRPEFQKAPFSEEIDTLIDLEKELYNLIKASVSPNESTALKRKERIETNQAARAVLSNQCETALYLTGNARTYYEAIIKRCSAHAEPEIQILFTRILLCLHIASPVLFAEHYFGKCALNIGAV